MRSRLVYSERVGANEGQPKAGRPSGSLVVAIIQSDRWYLVAALDWATGSRYEYGLDLAPTDFEQFIKRLFETRAFSLEVVDPDH